MRKSRLMAKINRLVNRKSAYPLLIHNWKNVGAPSILGDVFNTEYFLKNLKPTTVDLSLFSRVMVIAPHQDDESIGCGGTLVKLSKSAKINTVFVTDGFTESLNHNQNIIEVREQEAKAAMDLVGAETTNLKFPNQKELLKPAHIVKLKEAIEQFQPDLILTPWLFDRPVKHRKTNVLLYQALIQSNVSNDLPIWGYQVHNTPLPNIVVDITEEKDIKQKMIRCHKSQMENVAPYDHFILGMNQWNAKFHPTHKRGYSEVFFGLAWGEYKIMFEKEIMSRLPEYVSF